MQGSRHKASEGRRAKKARVKVKRQSLASDNQPSLERKQHLRGVLAIGHVWESCRTRVVREWKQMKKRRGKGK